MIILTSSMLIKFYSIKKEKNHSWMKIEKYLHEIRKQGQSWI